MISRNRQGLRFVSSCAAILIGSCISSVFAPSSAFGHDPDGQFVQSMVVPARDFLANRTSSSLEYGEASLIGIALIKADVPYENRRIQQAVQKIQEWLATDPAPQNIYTMYEPALALIFLCELDPQEFRSEIEHLLDLIERRHAAMYNGGWGYTGRGTGDVSQTQYCCLAMWEAHKHGFKVDPNMGRETLNWLLTIQDVSGGFPYQGIYRGEFNRIAQGQVTLSMSAAGLGSVYITADWLGYGGDKNAKKNRKQSEGLPATVTLVTDESDGEEAEILVKINEGQLDRARRDGIAWFNANFNVDGGIWAYYYLYGYERYASFREKAEGIDEREPAWYNAGCEFLKERQQTNGSWRRSNSESNEDVDTAFCLLFLLRSTKKTIGIPSYTDGMLQGGNGLDDNARVVMKNGRVVSAPVAKDISFLSELLSDPSDSGLEFFVESVKSLDLASDSKSRTEQRALLMGLVNNKEWQARLIAVRTLGSERRLENVPALLYALTDPDIRVARAANEGLKFVSRKVSGYEMPEKPDESTMKALKQRWTEWYLALVPDAVLLDVE